MSLRGLGFGAGGIRRTGDVLAEGVADGAELGAREGIKDSGIAPCAGGTASGVEGTAWTSSTTRKVTGTTRSSIPTTTP